MSRWSQIIQSAAPLPDYMIIDGARISAAGRDTIEVNDPGSGLKLCDVPAATPDYGLASGGMKQSGIGRQKGLAALANYVEKKAIAITL